MKNQSQATPGKSFVSAFRTGILVAAAFFAGLGVANLSAINGPAPAQTPLPQGSEEAQPETTAKIHHRPENRPPSNEIRDWYVPKDLNSKNGNTYKTIEHYHIQEVPFLVATYFYDKDTNKLIQKDTLYDYRYYPDIKESYMSDGKLGASRCFYNFSKEYFAPESAQIKTLLNDGSYDIVDVEYNISTKKRNTKTERDALHDATMDVMNSFLEGLYGE